MNKSFKLALLASISAMAIYAVAGWDKPSAIPPSQAETAHGDGHGHQPAEEKHDEGKEEQHGHGHEEGHESAEGGEHAEEGTVALTSEQVTTANISVETSGPGKLSREVSVPGKIIAAADRMAQIVPKVGGTVTEARKNLGDVVEKGEVLALIESREMAEAAAEYMAAKRAEELSRTTFRREKDLWDKKITAEQDYLNAKNAYQEAGIRLDLAKQKLQALGHEGSIDPKANTRFHELKSPIVGRVIERELTLGEYVDTTHSAFTVADLSVVWVETAIAPGDLPFVKEGQSTSVVGNGGKGDGKLIFVSPAINAETRAAKAIIELDNQSGLWRPGEFAKAAIATSDQDVDLVVPKEAVQAIEGKPAIFVRTDHGFEKRDITTGREDSKYIEVLSGLTAGEPVAVSNTFTLKAELGKSEAGHEH